MGKLRAWAAPLLAIATLTGEAASRPSGVDVHWDAPTAICPSETDVLSRLEELLGKPLEDSDARYTIILRVREESDHWDLKLWSIAADGTKYRSVSADTCESLAEFGVVITAFLVDPEALDTLPEGSSALERVDEVKEMKDEEGPPPPIDDREPAPAPESPTEEKDDAPSEDGEGAPPPKPDSPEPEKNLQPAMPARPRSDRAKFSGRVAGGVSVGPLPALAPTVQLGVGMEFEDWSARLNVQGELPQDEALGAERGVVEVSLYSATLMGCRVWRHGLLSSHVCLLAEAGPLFASGVQLETNTSETGVWAAVGLAPSFSFQLNRSLALFLEPQGLLAVGRTKISVDNFGLVHQPAVINFRGVGGVQWAFGSR